MARTMAAELASILARLEAVADRAEEDRASRHSYEVDAQAHREVTNRALQELKQGQEITNERLGKIEPVTSSLNDFRKSVMGGVLVLGFVGSTFLAVLYYFQELVVAYFKG